ncbi:thioredoxin family protein [endosymbiont of Ridgeia piscesae]|jgi:thioredoxin-related protein|uniref:Thioredoxin-related protein n=1 Tax=endosymbiont of Ridgeia piscesae TaxID=54398 RepID=A0A0T5Z772_9GAMM|nr:thioredoxin fold domain-containing protein [endosymbiont of Ridgeia piscesae]KRT56056.1 Thioredoxin-related protein [endosymbiont of Ridgeia piscesae]KRT58775.1 Thioredoxin-related protein [endosymbiont of Ridgeia piscesae]
MKLSWLLLAIGLLSISIACHADEGDSKLGAGLVNPGYHEKPDWFKQSFLDLQEDVEAAAGEGKRLLLYFHQDGCPYCAKLLNENFSLRSTVERIQQGFHVVAINMWGDRAVTDLQGNATTEKAIASKLKVMYTPTLLFLDEQGRDEVFRTEAFLKTFHTHAAIDYVLQEKYRTQPSFQHYVQERAEHLETQGIKVDLMK